MRKAAGDAWHVDALDRDPPAGRAQALLAPVRCQQGPAARVVFLVHRSLPWRDWTGAVSATLIGAGRTARTCVVQIIGRPARRLEPDRATSD